MRWPPLIEDAHMPLWARARDIILTLLAWCALIWMVHGVVHGVVLAVGFAVLDVLGIAHPTPPWAKGKVLRDLLPFLAVVILLVAWLCLFAWLRWNSLTDTRMASRQPLPLDPEDMDGLFGVSAKERAGLRRGSVVDFPGDGS